MVAIPLTGIRATLNDLARVGARTTADATPAVAAIRPDAAKIDARRDAGSLNLEFPIARPPGPRTNPIKVGPGHSAPGRASCRDGFGVTESPLQRWLGAWNGRRNEQAPAD